MRILVVDDEKLLVKGITFNLENDGYQVDGAYDGQQALELFSQNTYDLIILDLMLPVYDGLSVCRKIRETSDVPVIMLTAKGESAVTGPRSPADRMRDRMMPDKKQQI